ncbi:DUF2309 family protein [Rhodobacterales bacterium HKCCE3408]|nr:DUF2309 family protein [Rhodobacterales bacterium HKCCE3408]
MFIKHSQIAPKRVSGLLDAAEAAIRAIPPAFPLEATVAVNPFLGQTGESLATTAARLSRVAGVPVTRDRADYAAEIKSGAITEADLSAAFEAAGGPKPDTLAGIMAALGTEAPAPQPLPTVADLATRATGTDWPSVIEKTFGLWAAGHFDTGQALWSPAPGRGAYAAWRDWACHDLTPEIAGLTGFASHVADAPDTAERAILRASERLGITSAAAETVFHRLLADLGGWAQHARWRLWQAELAGETDRALADLLAIRLVWEEALFAHLPTLEAEWRPVVTAHQAQLTPTADQVIDAILQDAAERAYQRRLAHTLTGPAERTGRPALQAAFCIDVRSEVFRRALEAQDAGIDTIGFAGFFGLPLSHTAHGSDVVENHLPVLLQPGMAATSHTDPANETGARIDARATRAWGRFRQAAVSSFAFIEAAGPFYAAKLLKQALGFGGHKAATSPAPRLSEALDAEGKAKLAATVLKAMSLTSGHAKTVLLLGHGAQVTNNPHESAYHCGACGGHTGEVSARILAQLLNDPETRGGLRGHGIELADDTVFVAGLHDTTTDDITLYAADTEMGRSADLSEIRGWLRGAGAMARAERALRMAGATAESVPARATNWAEIRPEWGLAGCAAFVAAPRTTTARRDLGGRAFLHSYHWQADEGFATLELILTAPVVVASWISLQYYGSAVAPDAFGGGNKLIHNVVGGIGVVEGNGGRLRPGLPWQAVHDGERLAHEPLRLSVLIEAPEAAITEILKRHPDVAALFDNGWLHLFTMSGGRVASRYRPGGTWTPEQSINAAA